MFFMPRMNNPGDFILFGAPNCAPNSVSEIQDKKYMSAVEAINDHNEVVVKQFKDENARLIDCILSIRDELTEGLPDKEVLRNSTNILNIFNKQIKLHRLEDLLCGANQEK